MKVIICLALIVSIFVVTAAAQDTKPKTPQEEAVLLQVEILKTEMEAKVYAIAPDNNKDKSDAASKLAALYRKATSLPGVGDYLASGIWSEFTSNRFQANSAPQVSQVANEASVKFQFLLAAQNQVLIDQNKRIIELLEAIAKRPAR